MHNTPTIWLSERSVTLHKALNHVLCALLPEGKPAFKDGEANFHITVNGITDEKTFILDRKWYPLARISYDEMVKDISCLDNKMVANWDDVRFNQNLSETSSTPVLN